MDKQESVLPKEKSIAYIRGLNSSEESISIAKEDLFDSKKMFFLQVGEEIDTGINHAGIISVSAQNITGSCAIGISALNGTDVMVLHEGSGSIVFVDIPDKVCVFKKNANGTFFAKNNSSYETPVSIALL